LPHQSPARAVDGTVVVAKAASKIHLARSAQNRANRERMYFSAAAH
jgi:cytidylate kinase